MTPALMSPDVRAELAGLSKTAKREVRSWLNNKLQIVLTVNGNEADDVKLPPMVRAQARLRNRIMSEFQKEIDTLFDLNPDRHLGAAE